MARYVLRRVLTMLPTLLLVSVVTFLLAHLMPGDPVLAFLGETAPRDQVAYDAMHKQLGLDRPVLVQYLRWMEQVARGNLGTSVRSQTPVGFELVQRLPVTLEQAALSFLGLGVQPPAPAWGSMLRTAYQYIEVDPWYSLFPGATIFLTVLAFNFLGDGLRQALDPRLRGST